MLYIISLYLRVIRLRFIKKKNRDKKRWVDRGLCIKLSCLLCYNKCVCNYRQWQLIADISVVFRIYFFTHYVDSLSVLNACRSSGLDLSFVFYQSKQKYSIYKAFIHASWANRLFCMITCNLINWKVFNCFCVIFAKSAYNEEYWTFIFRDIHYF